jgi:sentrin-specific protease 1
VDITPKDITSLTEENWLNDVVIDGYLALVKDESFETTGFTIYFYRGLMNKPIEEMLRWTKKTHLFGTRLVHIPVNDTGSHWCLVTIDHQEKMVTARDSIRGQEDEPEIRHILSNIKNMMGYDILMNPLSRGFNIEDYRFLHDRTMPRQNNGNDCGVFACQAARYISAHKPITFTQNDMPYL